MKALPFLLLCPLLVLPTAADFVHAAEGMASFYSVETCKANPESGCPMASGLSLHEVELYRYPFCASWDFPLGTWLRVQNLENGRVTLCHVLDRGPVPELYAAGRIIDLSWLVFERLGGTVEQGIIKVNVESVSAVRG